MKIAKILEKFGYQKEIIPGDIITNPIRNIRITELQWGTDAQVASWNVSERIMYMVEGKKFYTFYVVPDNGDNFYIKKTAWNKVHRSTLPLRLLSNV